ncbi:MAG TPA: hypothetical protein VF337_01820 [Candidatus Limnocylindrales bacterium]
MTIVASHVGPVSGLTHFHLKRENAATRAGKAQSLGQSDAALGVDGAEQYSGVEIPSGIDRPFERAEAQLARSR